MHFFGKFCSTFFGDGVFCDTFLSVWFFQDDFIVGFLDSFFHHFVSER